MITATTTIQGLKNRFRYKQYEVSQTSISIFLEQMRLLEIVCKNQQSQVEVAVTLVEESEELYKTKSLVVGNGNGFHVFEAIEEQLLELYPEARKEISDLMTTLVLEVSKETEPISKTIDEKVQQKLQEERVVEQPQEVIVPANEPIQEPVQKAKIKRSFLLSKKAIAIVIGGILIAGVGYTGFSILNQAPSYETLLAEERYVEAVRLYPEQKNQVEQKLFTNDSNSIEKLEDYVTQTGSTSALFDLSYLKKEYEKVVELQAEANTSIRKTALAVSFTKVGEIDKAFELNKNLNSNKLKQLIAEAYEEQATQALKQLDVAKAEEIQAKIHTLSLQNKLDRVNKILSEETSIKNQLADSSITEEKKAELETQLKQTQENIEKIKKGVF